MIAAALALGLLVGGVLGLVGAGGSIIAVPALVYGVGMSTHEAIPSALLVVGVSSIAAVIPRIRTGISWRIALLVGAAGIPAAWAGAAVGRLFNENVLLLAFAAIMIAAGIRMLSHTKETPSRNDLGKNNYLRNYLLKSLAVGLGIGFLTGLLGVGGGFLIVPALTIFLGLSMAQAVGTSLIIIVINSAAGFSAHATGFSPDWTPTLALAITAIIGSLAAGRVAHKLNNKYVRIAFASLVFTVAAIVVISTTIGIVN
ncbi:sulfite exporter TauE/SafE family protein [Brevibacterium aurantiacum]|uniref:sulfite exporter TauE/SafE family protein n=1 Tax=Brevibacterium aurantiacum TaxID=273384 RepID=UPI00299F8895|nr:sulfite exporter TauE/SafE family protein [Brevibacterium aurantiacum]